MEIEVFKPVVTPSCPSLSESYSVSNKGNVFSFKAGRCLRPSVVRDRYPMFYLSLDGKVHGFSGHFLVASAFHGARKNERLQVNHKNGIKNDNRAENLEWVTPSENTKHAFRVLGRQVPRGEKSAVSKLKENDVLEIRNWYKTGDVSQGALAKVWGVSQTLIGLIVRKAIWSHVDHPCAAKLAQVPA